MLRNSEFYAQNPELTFRLVQATKKPLYKDCDKDFSNTYITSTETRLATCDLRLTVLSTLVPHTCVSPYTNQYCNSRYNTVDSVNHNRFHP